MFPAPAPGSHLRVEQSVQERQEIFVGRPMGERAQHLSPRPEGRIIFPDVAPGHERRAAGLEVATEVVGPRRSPREVARQDEVRHPHPVDLVGPGVSLDRVTDLVRIAPPPETRPCVRPNWRDITKMSDEKVAQKVLDIRAAWALEGECGQNTRRPITASRASMRAGPGHLGRPPDRP